MLYVTGPSEPKLTVSFSSEELAELLKAEQLGLFGQSAGPTRVKTHVRRGKDGGVATVHEHTRTTAPAAPHVPTAPHVPRPAPGPLGRPPTPSPQVKTAADFARESAAEQPPRPAAPAPVPPPKREPTPDPPAAGGIPVKVDKRVMIEFHILEADGYSEDEKHPPRGRADFVKAVQQRKNETTLHLTPDALHYLRTDALPNCMDIWGDQEETKLLAAGKALAASLPAASAIPAHGTPMAPPEAPGAAGKAQDVTFMSSLTPQRRKALQGALDAYNVADGLAKQIATEAHNRGGRGTLEQAYWAAAEKHMRPVSRDLSGHADHEIDHFMGLSRTHPALHSAALTERHRRGERYAEKLAGWTDDDLGTVARHFDGTNVGQSLVQHDLTDKHARKLWKQAGLPHKDNGDPDVNPTVRHGMNVAADARGWTSATGAGMRHNRKADAPPWPPPAPATRSKRDEEIDAIRANNARLQALIDHPDTKPWKARHLREHVVDERALGNIHRTSMDLADMRSIQEEAMNAR